MTMNINVLLRRQGSETLSPQSLRFQDESIQANPLKLEWAQMKAQKQLRVNIQILKSQIYSLSTSLFNSGIILCLVFNFGSPELSFFLWLWGSISSWIYCTHLVILFHVDCLNHSLGIACSLLGSDFLPPLINFKTCLPSKNGLGRLGDL